MYTSDIFHRYACIMSVRQVTTKERKLHDSSRAFLLRLGILAVRGIMTAVCLPAMQYFILSAMKQKAELEGWINIIVIEMYLYPVRLKEFNQSLHHKVYITSKKPIMKEVDGKKKFIIREEKPTVFQNIAQLVDVTVVAAVI
uniref:Uncharacterized protein n=1 Tax=Glossina pallidipes TaxID=7398 RepID=A0A1A9ZC00_GLOPL